MPPRAGHSTSLASVSTSVKERGHLPSTGTSMSSHRANYPTSQWPCDDTPQMTQVMVSEVPHLAGASRPGRRRNPTSGVCMCLSSWTVCPTMPRAPAWQPQMRDTTRCPVPRAGQLQALHTLLTSGRTMLGLTPKGLPLRARDGGTDRPGAAGLHMDGGTLPARHRSVFSAGRGRGRGGGSHS